MSYDDITSIAVGHSNTGGLALITSLSAGGVALLPVLSFGMYSRGERKFKANGVPYYSGEKSKHFLSFLTAAQYTYIRDTYSGNVTVHSWLENTTAYTYNAVLWFEEVEDYEGANIADYGLGWSLPNVKWNLNAVQVIP